MRSNPWSGPCHSVALFPLGLSFTVRKWETAVKDLQGPFWLRWPELSKSVTPRPAPGYTPGGPPASLICVWSYGEAEGSGCVGSKLIQALS